MRQAIIVIAITILLVTVLVASEQTTTAPATTVPSVTPEMSWELYEIIVNRNIFSRDRTVPLPYVPTSQPPPKPAEYFVVLTGVAVQGDYREAFFEDNRTGRTLRAVPGETLVGGTITAVTLDGVEFTSNGVTRTIALGENLSGASGDLGPATTQRTDQSETPTDSGTGDILERMRLRRLQELK